MGAPIVQELLSIRNYGKWTVWMKTYLMSEGLWGIVVGMEPKPQGGKQARDWEMKNCKALHAILVSCRDEIFPIISGMDSAKEAWNEIWTFMLPYHSSLVNLQGPSTSAGTSIDNNTWRRKLYEAVVDDDWVAAKLIIDNHQEVLNIRVFGDETLLHTAVLHNHVNFVEELLTVISPKDTEITMTNRGNFTALHLAVGRGNLEMVEVLVHNNPRLLVLKDKYHRLPLTIASLSGNVAVMYFLGEHKDYLSWARNPSQAILDEDYGMSIDNNTWHAKLYMAVVKDDWVAAKRIIDDDHREALIDPFLMDQTLLHTAVLHDHVDFVKELLNEISSEHTEITLPNRGNFTALHLAVERGNLEMVKVLTRSNPNLLCLKDKYERDPLSIAYLSRNEAVLGFVKENTYYFRRSKFVIRAILHENYGDALEEFLFHKLSPFAENEEGLTALEALAGKPSGYTSGNQLKFWQRWIYKCINVPPYIEGRVDVSSNAAIWLRRQCWDAANFITAGLIEKIYNMKLNDVQGIQLLATMSDHISNLDDSEIDEDIIRNAMETAYRFGNAEFIEKMHNPTLLQKKVIIFRLMQNAIVYRQERIWATLFCGILYHRIVEELWKGKSLLNEVAKLPPSSQLNKVSGPAMQMQRELQWFKEVETLVKPYVRGLEIVTARELFTKEHKDLIKEAEKWMKETSTSCMVVTTLIATVMFAAAFTVPGGNDGQKGIPIFLPETSFLVFIIADALSLFSSTTSILMFLSILTSRFAEEFFLESLPKKLIIGLATLFFSIATMMVAFSATIVIVLHERYKWVAIPVSLFASVPITLFVLLQLPLFVDMVLSTYGPSIFRERTESKLVFYILLLRYALQVLIELVRNAIRDVARWIVKCLAGPAPAPEAQTAEPQSAEDHLQRPNPQRPSLVFGSLNEA